MTWQTPFSFYWNTLKHLKWKQFYYRLYHNWHNVNTDLPDGLGTRPVSGAWTHHPLYPRKWLDERVALFLNEHGTVETPADWNASHKSKLWLYNLHYFDDLVAVDARSRFPFHRALLSRWINENPPALGNGWEPYPLSLRIVNWIKWMLRHEERNGKWLDSLALQAKVLSQRLEHHLLGNHLFVNAKALIFAGLFFEGKDAEKWLITGLSIYQKELDEQVLADGGNFERSPMYHAIMLVDLLDLLNLFHAYPGVVPDDIVSMTREKACGMLKWLNYMSHLDGKISFFNDAAWGVAPDNSIIESYGQALGLPAQSGEEIGIIDLNDSGYVVYNAKNVHIIADLAPIGPDYIPGHAHADTLSFELSLGGQRVFVNSGTSEYGISPERLRQRKTPAHNTVSINGLDSSQVWSGFRVAKRARIVERYVDAKQNVFSAVHNGFYQQGVRCLHKRIWRAKRQGLQVIDDLNGKFSMAESFWHFHPELEIIQMSDTEVIAVSSEFKVKICCQGGRFKLEDSTWHPEFGLAIPNKKLVLRFSGHKTKVNISWSQK